MVSTKCRFIILDQCTATGHEFTPREDICRACRNTSRGIGINEVTILEASKALQDRNLPVPSYLRITGLDLEHGPGTNLKRVLSWFVTKPPGCPCDDRAVMMNLWGRKGCYENYSTILSWLRESALDNNIRYSEFVIDKLVKGVIYFSRERP